MTTTRLKSASLAINGIIAITLGILFIFMPEEMADTFVKVIGALLGASAIIMLIFAYFHNKTHGVANVALVIQGVINLGLGLTMVLNPQLMLQFIFLGVGIWTLAIGVFQIIYALQVRKIVNSGIFLLVNGIAFGGIGSVLILDYQSVLHPVLLIIGGGLTILGTVLIVFSIKVQLYNKRVEKGITVKKLESDPLTSDISDNESE